MPLLAQETVPISETPGPACINADKIKDYQIETDRVIRLILEGDQDMMMSIKGFCPQLKYHQYFTYTPTNGQICANIHDIVTRAGQPCRIKSFKPIPSPKKEPAPPH